MDQQTTGHTSPPESMIWVKGGIVTLGDYEQDPAGWSRREMVLSPFAIDRVASVRDVDPLPPFRIASAPELEFALRQGIIEFTDGPEITSSILIPEDADALMDLEDVGFYTCLLDGPTRILLGSPYDPLVTYPSRRVWITPDGTAAARRRMVRLGAHTRRGRGEHWPLSTGFSALGTTATPIYLPAFTDVLSLIEDNGWALVSHADNPEIVFGWIPQTVLSERL